MAAYYGGPGAMAVTVKRAERGKASRRGKRERVRERRLKDNRACLAWVFCLLACRGLTSRVIQKISKIEDVSSQDKGTDTP